MTRTLVATPDPEPEDPLPDLYRHTHTYSTIPVESTVTVTTFPPLVAVEQAVEPGSVLNAVFNPSASDGLESVLKGKDVDGWALLRVVHWTPYEAVAVFERLSE